MIPKRERVENDLRRLPHASLEVARVNWFSTYHAHHRVANRFRSSGIFLLGDAAHIHSPVGGQGMNTGVGDAINLAWKLAAAMRGRADATLLGSYEPERMAFARRLVATTDRVFTVATSRAAWDRFIRLEIVLLLLPFAFTSRLASIREKAASSSALNFDTTY